MGEQGIPAIIPLPSVDGDVTSSINEEVIKLIHQNECWDLELEAFQFWVLVWSDGVNYFHYRYPFRNLPDDLSTLFPAARLIPKHYYTALAPHDLTLAPNPLPDDTFVKLFNPIRFNPEREESTHVADMMIREANVCEILSKNPHPNIAEYRGYIQNDGMMAGLCFKRYSQNLFRAREARIAINTEKVIDGVRSGLKHLHNLGLIHNDINPENIMLNSQSNPVIIDFDSCQRVGSNLVGKSGTPNWSRDVDVAEEANDMYSLNLVEAWLLEHAT